MDYPIAFPFETPQTAEDARRLLVLANRILANEGVFDAFGHISIRNPENPSTFFISRALSPEFVGLCDLVELDFEGNLISGDPNARTFLEKAIHCAVYAARPDVRCVCHPHPPEILPFCCTDIPLRSIHHLNVSFFEGLPLFSDMPDAYGVMVNDLPLARKLAETLGDKRGVLIRNHGVVVVGESQPRAVYSSITLRDGAKALTLALSMGGTVRYLTREEQEYGLTQQFCKAGLSRSWNYWCVKAKAAFPDIAALPHQ